MQDQIKFGISQITNRTPAIANWIFRGVLYTAAAVSIVIGIIDEIPADVRFMINKYNIYAVTIVHAFSKLFGVEVSKPNYDFDGYPNK